MLTAKQFEALKKGNVSADPQKSSKRVSESFKNAKSEQKNEIAKLAGTSKNGFYKGVSSPKSILAIAQVLKISPYYLSAESDSEDYTDDKLNEFYKRCIGGNKKSVAAKPRKNAKPKPEKVKPDAKQPTEKPLTALAPQTQKTVTPPVTKPQKHIKIDDTSLVKLFEALAIRAKFGGEAEQTYNAIVELLVK